jgi:hypothetical protein
MVGTYSCEKHTHFIVARKQRERDEYPISHSRACPLPQ